MILFYSIFDHFYLIINDLYAIVFYYYSMTSIYIPYFSFVFYITIFVLYNSDLYSIFSYLYSIFVRLYSIVLIYSLSFHFLLYNCLFRFNISFICIHFLFHYYSIFHHFFSIFQFLYCRKFGLYLVSVHYYIPKQLPRSVCIERKHSINFHIAWS